MQMWLQKWLRCLCCWDVFGPNKEKWSGGSSHLLPTVSVWWQISALCSVLTVCITWRNTGAPHALCKRTKTEAKIVNVKGFYWRSRVQLVKFSGPWKQLIFPPSGCQRMESADWLHQQPVYRKPTESNRKGDGPKSLECDWRKLH